MFAYPTLSEADLSGKRVLLRAGFDVPVENAQVTDRRRIEALLPTMKHILDEGASLILMAHQGRPKGDRVPEMTQKPLVPVLTELLNVDVQFAEDCRGEETQRLAGALQPGEVLLLENLRYDPAEKSKEDAERAQMGKDLAALADVYVNDAFTNCHRNHASMVDVTRHLPSYMGLHVEKEVQYLQSILDKPKKPLLLIISGLKMETKVPVVEQFLSKGDDVLLGGGIANTFLAACGFDVAKSKYEEEFFETAQRIMLESEKEDKAFVHVPSDVVVASEPREGVEKIDIPVEDVVGDMIILDIGKVTMQKYLHAVATAGMIVWNGPLGMCEVEDFAEGTKKLAKAIAEATANGATSIIGGGDTLDFHDRYPEFSIDAYSHVSTGGGAMLDIISGKKLPALEALRTNS